MELFAASHQWAKRPDDERFSSIEELYKVTKMYAASAQERHEVPYSSLRVVAQDRDIVLVTKQDSPLKMTHYAFGQLAGKIKAPAEYLRELPPTLAAQNINHGLKQLGESSATASLMMHKNSELVLRSITSDKYTRYWNWEIAERLLKAKDSGWKTPPALPALPNQKGTRKATQDDIQRLAVNGWGIKVGDDIAPAGIYASAHDMFVFMVNEENRVKDGSVGGLGRGLFFTNSEVGNGGINITRFLYRFVCGNHIVWGAQEVKKIRIRHIGDMVKYNVASAFYAEMVEYAETSAKEDELMIKRARTFKIGNTKEEVLEYLFGKRAIGLPKKSIELAYDSAIPDIDGAPTTVWGFVQGLTRASQATPYADVRSSLDSASGPIMQLAR
jgi:hypothetical protein